MATETIVNTVTGEVLPVSSDARMAAYLDMITSVPLREGDGGEGIVLDILNATSPEDWAAKTKLPSSKDLVGAQMLVQRIERGESDEEGGNGWYLFVHATDHRRNPIMWTTGAGSIMAKLVQLNAWGALPALVKITQATKATGSGRFPLDLDVLNYTTPKGLKKVGE